MDDLKAKVQEHLDRAYSTGHWMVAVFRRDDEGVKINRVTGDFQTGDFLKCIELTAANLFAEQERVKTAGTLLPPLPRANIDLPPDAIARMQDLPSMGCATPPSSEVERGEVVMGWDQPSVRAEQ